MAEGLKTSFYSHFLSLLWKDGDLAYLSEADSSVHSEWDSFRSIIMEMCRSSATSKMIANPIPQTSWEFLISSKFHENFCKNNFVAQNSSVMALDVRRLDASRLNTNSTQRLEKTFYSELLMESLHCLHAVYESLKLNNLRKRCVLSFVIVWFPFLIFLPICFLFLLWYNVLILSSSHTNTL